VSYSRQIWSEQYVELLEIKIDASCMNHIQRIMQSTYNTASYNSTCYCRCKNAKNVPLNIVNRLVNYTQL